MLRGGPRSFPRFGGTVRKISVAPFGGRFRSRNGSLAALPRRPPRTKAAKRSAENFFDVVNAILRELYNSCDDKVAKCGVHRATNSHLTFLKAAFMFAASGARLLLSAPAPEKRQPSQSPVTHLVSRWGGRGAKARLNWDRRRAPHNRHDRPCATTRLCTLGSAYYISSRIRRLWGKQQWKTSIQASALARLGKRMMTWRAKLDPFTTTSGTEGTGLAMAGSWWILQSCWRWR